MAKPAFNAMWLNYPKGDPKSVFTHIGWGEFYGKPGWENTCALRMSIALGLSGVAIKSSAGMRALAGPLKGKWIEPRQDRLSENLREIWGEPLKCDAALGNRRLAGTDGVISFWQIAGYDVGGQLGGHIDLIDGSVVEEKDWWGHVIDRTISYRTAHGNYMDKCKSIWFWKL
ncbi:hypothetical protein D1610_04785 [Sphingomonas gilva]|uniref:Type VI secretion system amidase effector protein Tae4 n=1 Tax=Sphingomonas gilva TaxID=2305907 RepID=A0A396RN31_9SPHN|nr:T6SS effector amidase Tae4 family protein [Sphingomonas gilva]RHW17840.1 hypothetical protein D1610_04785 [Sphingomonas gilva]